MSASQEKKTRAQRESEEQKEARKFRRNAIIVVVVLVIVVAVAAVINSNLFYNGITAVTVGNTNYSAAEVSVFFRNTFNTIYNNMGSYASLLVDTSTPLDEQQYSTDRTWADYVYDETLESMKRVTALYNAAVAEGAPTEDDLAEIESEMSSVNMYASLYGTTASNLLSSTYGRGVTEKVYRGVLTKMIVAQSYSEKISDGFSYSDAQLESWYEENKDDYDVISYYFYFVSVSNDAFSATEGDDAKLTAARAAAAEIATAADVEDFIAKAKEFSEAANPTEQHTMGSSLSSSYSEWLLSPDRKAGDVTSIDTDTGAYALFFTGRDTNDYSLVAMRHILIMAEADENGEYSDEAKAAATARIEEIQAEWQADPTEDKFAELANSYSEDTGSNTAGGLYENIYKHQMVEGINDFLFDAARQPGDTDVIPNDGSYVGTHLVYYVGAHDDLYRSEIADAQLRSADYSTYIEGLTANYTVKTGAGLRFATLK